MPKHHSEDYKISAVQYYLDNKTTYSNVCKIFKCCKLVSCQLSTKVAPKCYARRCPISFGISPVNSK